MASDHRQPEPVASLDLAPALSAHVPPTGSLARLQRALVLLAAALSLAAMAWLWHAGHPGWALLAVLAVPALHAIVLGAEFVWMQRVNLREPGPSAPWRSVFRAWRGECVDAMQVFGLWQPFLSRWPADPIPADAAGRRGVVLVHGFVCNRGLWRHWVRQLGQRQVPALAINLEPVFGRIDDYVPIIDAAVRRMQRLTGLAPVVVCHSMGGLAVRRWRRDAGDTTSVHHLITIGSPHHGTCLARFATVPNARQMRRGQPWLAELDAGEPATVRRRTTCFYSDCDNIVFPAASAMLAGADNRLLRGVGHISLARRPEPWQFLLDRLSDPADAPSPDAGAAAAAH